MNARRSMATAIVAFLLVAGVWLALRVSESWAAGADRLILLVPDGVSIADSRVKAWVDAASEEGLHVVPMHDSTYMRPLLDSRACAGLILPDGFHVNAGDLMVSTIRDYVANGGHLMLVYDAATKSSQGFYSSEESRLSDLAGVRYALYKSLGAEMIRSSAVSGSIPTMDELGVPPGKYFPFVESQKEGEQTSAQLRRYQFGDLEYPSFVTMGDYAGDVLLRSSSNVAAGLHPFGKGSVLFVNLPLTTLVESTDGLPLHAFLNYFAVHVLALPFLLAVPDGVGGIVLNWHVDSNAAIQSLQAVSTWPMTRQGPYSIDITAGPDDYRVGDHEGFDVPGNPVSRELVRELVRSGDEVGSHGGWMHDYFSANVDKDPPEQMEKYLELNKAALEEVTGKPVIEYSAPNGNQPEWVTRWLEAHGFIAYYFTGDTGMGPTQGYRDGHRDGQTIWAFPIVHLDCAASFEEMERLSVPSPVVESWLDALTDFVVRHRQVRLAYFHPPGILPYRRIVDAWFEKTGQLRAQGKFRWYTMAQVARFLNSRNAVTWSLKQQKGVASLTASAPTTLAHEAWRFPARKYGQPVVRRGSAEITEVRDGWMVVAGEGDRLEIESRVSGQ